MDLLVGQGAVGEYQILNGSSCFFARIRRISSRDLRKQRPFYSVPILRGNTSTKFTYPFLTFGFGIMDPGCIHEAHERSNIVARFGVILMLCLKHPAGLSFDLPCGFAQDSNTFPQKRIEPPASLLKPSGSIFSGLFRLGYFELDGFRGAEFGCQLRAFIQELLLGCLSRDGRGELCMKSSITRFECIAIPAETFPWASLWQIKAIILLDNVVGPCVRTVIAAL
jgi:hypothetical protein